MIRKRILAVDSETTGLDTRAPGFTATHASYWTNNGRGKAFPIASPDFQKLKAWAEDESITKLIFNAKYDLRVFAIHGITFRGPVIDVLLMAQLVLPDEKRKNLKHLSRKYLKEPYLEEIRLKKWLRENKKTVYGDAPAHIVLPYALADARRLLELFFYLSAAIDKFDLWPVVEREMLLMRKVVMPMEDHGIRMDLEAVAELSNTTRKEQAKLRAAAVEITGNPEFNPNSQKQLLKALADEGIFKPTRFSNKTGKPKADTVSLIEWPSPLATIVMKLRRVSKARTTYLKHFNSEILRVSFNQNGARTGRFSSSDPNLQNIPRPDEDSLLGKMRICFIARKGRRLLFVDYKQLQLRLAAHFSGEQHMIDAINSGKDLHDGTCHRIFEIDKDNPKWEILRYLAKTLNFSMLFGAGATKFRETVLKDTDGEVRLTLQQASTYIQQWKAKHPAIMKMFDTIIKEVSATKGVRTMYGRFMPVDLSKPYVGVNYKIQGSEADMLKERMLRLEEFLLGKKTKIMLQAHDELCFDWHPDDREILPDIKNIMEEFKLFKVPLTCSFSYGKNWYAKKKLEV